jgi:hypothetical protein
MSWSFSGRGSNGTEALYNFETAANLTPVTHLPVAMRDCVIEAAATLAHAMGHEVVCSVSTSGHISTDSLNSFASVSVQTKSPEAPK